MITDELILDNIVDEIYDVLEHERNINYEADIKLNIGDKMLTAKQKKELNQYCTTVMIANVAGFFILACVFDWILLLLLN